jgi:hypothetical protein
VELDRIDELVELSELLLLLLVTELELRIIQVISKNTIH